MMKTINHAQSAGCKHNHTRSNNQGLTFGAPILLSSDIYGNPTGGCGTPRIATNNSGVWTVVWQNAWLEDVYYRTYNTNNLDLSDPTRLHTDSEIYPGSEVYNHVESEPQIACSNDGYWIITFSRTCVNEADQYGWDPDVFFATDNRSRTESPVFSAPQALLEALDGSDCDAELYPQIDVSPAGDFMMFWKQLSPIFPYQQNPCAANEDTLRILWDFKPTTDNQYLSGVAKYPGNDGFLIQDNLVTPGINPVDLAVRHTDAGWYLAWAQKNYVSPQDYDIYVCNPALQISRLNSYGATDNVDDRQPRIGSSGPNVHVAWQTSFALYSAYHGQNILTTTLTNSVWSAVQYLDRVASSGTGTNANIRMTSTPNITGSLAVWDTDDYNHATGDRDVIGAAFGM